MDVKVSWILAKILSKKQHDDLFFNIDSNLDDFMTSLTYMKLSAILVPYQLNLNMHWEAKGVASTPFCTHDWESKFSILKRRK